jgi:cytochrome bd-type quinol oxidase subunit 1
VGQNEAAEIGDFALDLLIILVPLQMFLGDQHGLNTLEYQPAKLAAIGHTDHHARIVGRPCAAQKPGTDTHHDKGIVRRRVYSPAAKAGKTAQPTPLTLFGIPDDAAATMSVQVLQQDSLRMIWFRVRA